MINSRQNPFHRNETDDENKTKKKLYGKNSVELNCKKRKNKKKNGKNHE